jgi:hypothetical protein
MEGISFEGIVEPGDIIGTLGNIAQRIRTSITGYIDNIDPEQFAQTVGTAIADFINGTVDLISGMSSVDGSGEALANIGAIVGQTIATAVTTIDWTSMAMTLAQVIGNNLLLTFQGIGAAFVTLGSFVSVYWQSGISTVSAMVGGVVNQVVSAISNGFVSLYNAVMGYLSGLANSASPLAGLAGFAAQAFSALANRARSFLSGLTAGIPVLGGSISRAIGGRRVASRAEGQNVGLLEAVMRENLAAPGTSPVVANSSEVILNRRQLRDVGNSLSSYAPAAGGNNYSFNISGVSDPEAIWRFIQEKMQREERRGMLNYVGQA